MNDDQFISFLSGLIDGDGTLLKQNKMFCLRIALHNSWCGILSYISNRLHTMFKGWKTNPRISIGKYTMLSISDRSILCKLHTRASGLGIPLLNRKWHKINHQYHDRDIELVNRKRVVWEYYNQGMNGWKIHLKTGIPKTTVYRIIKEMRGVPV